MAATKDTTRAAKLAALLKRKFPGRRKPHRSAPAWMPGELADLYTRIGTETLIAPSYGRVMSPAECKSQRALMDGVDARGEWLGATWQPFAKDAGGGMLVFDTKTARLIYCDAPTTGEPPKVVAPSVASWIEATTRALSKVPDPPDPDEDDYIEEEQETLFAEALHDVLLKGARRAAKPTPRAGVPPALPPPDDSIPKAIQLFATFKETKKHGIDGLYIGRGLGTTEGKSKLASMGLMYGSAGAWPMSMHRLVFVRGRDARKQGHALIVVLDTKRLEALVTVDDIEDADRFVKEADRILKKLGLLFDVIDDETRRRHVVKRFQKYIDPN